jgi:hypothetical protein
MRIFGSHASRPATEHRKEIKKTDIAVSEMIRAQPGNCMTCANEHKVYDCGHFMRRKLMATRFHPWNIGKQGVKENRFEGGRTFEYGLAIDAKYGAGAAAFPHKLSKTIEPWSIVELQQLRSAARVGSRAYEQLYQELRPHHFRA